MCVCAVCLVAQLCPTLCNPMDYQAPLSMGILQTRILEWVAMPSSRGFSQTRDWTQVSPTMQVDSLSSEPPGKPTNTGVGSLSLLQGIFPTQGSNRSLLDCRQILYQLSYQESPLIVYFTPNNCFLCTFVLLGTFSYVASRRCWNKT